MIIALLALAFAMIVGGLLAAFFGWDIVLVERGWTMVIAGSITAASGALLLGIAAAVSKLAQIEHRLSMLRGGFAEDELTATRASTGALAGMGMAGGLAAGQAAAADDEHPDESQPTLPLFEEEERRERDEATVSVGEWPEDRDAAPIISFPPRTVSVSPSPSDEEESDLKVPDFLLADRDRDDEEEARVAETALDVDLQEKEDREPEPRDLDESDQDVQPVPDLEPEPEPTPDIEPVAEEDDQEALREEELPFDETRPPAVIGTYNSGDNKYVMFSNGSIEAQTPSGVFRFQSLEELKEFIAAGGEGNSSPSI